MSSSRDYNKQPLTIGEEILHLIASEAYLTKLTPSQRDLLEQIGSTGILNTDAQKVTLTIPPDVGQQDLKAVLTALDAITHPAFKIMIPHEMTRDRDLLAKVDRDEFRRVAKDLGVGDSRYVRAFLDGQPPRQPSGGLQKWKP